MNFDYSAVANRMIEDMHGWSVHTCAMLLIFGWYSKYLDTNPELDTVAF